MSKELKITEDAVLAASARCPQARDTLETLFPEVFNKFEPLTLSFTFSNLATFIDVYQRININSSDLWKVYKDKGIIDHPESRKFHDVFKPLEDVARRLKLDTL